MKKLLTLGSLAFALAVSLAVLNGCSSKQNHATQIDLLKDYMDTTVNPGDDFFRYAVGTWLKNNPIAASERSNGIWLLVQNETYDRLKKINEDAAADKNAKAGTNQQKIGDFWFTGMDTVSIEKQGITPLQSELDRINGISDKSSLTDAIAYYQTIGVGPLFGAYIYQDEMNSEKVMMHLYQGGLGLPDRDYYFKTETRFVNYRTEYLKHISAMLQLIGEDVSTADADAKKMMTLETALAKASKTVEQMRDTYANYNKMTLDDANKITPGIDWKDMFSKMQINNLDSVIVCQPDFFKVADKLLSTVSINDWKIYLRYQLLSSFAGNLSSAFDKENFHFYGTILSGVPEQRPRWKRVLDSEESLMGDALGQLYVQKYFSETTKQRYVKMVDAIFDAYRSRIQNLDWMTDSTKQKAISKLNHVTKKVGYPDKWKDYSTMQIDRSSYLHNIIQGNLWHYQFEVSKLFKPVDRTEWDMTPQTYNAYYNPSNNEIVLPAAMFIIPGWPDSLIDDAVVYGYAGASTIGHEITHGFDDQGRQFDEKGNLKPWWSMQDSIAFAKRAQGLINQFSNYVVLDSMHINGAQTLGENIADLGGVVLGYEALKKTDAFKNNEVIDGLTPTQRFYLGYALSWMGEYRDESIAQRVVTDVHSPNFLRINGPLSDVDPWYEAFHVTETNKMFLPDSLRVKIW